MSLDLPQQISACTSRIALARALIDEANDRGDKTSEVEQALRHEKAVLERLHEKAFVERLAQLLSVDRARGSPAPKSKRAAQLVDGASFGPDALKAIGQAFDAAWAEIEVAFGDVAIDIDNARYRLANALLSVASEESRDVDALKRAALQRMTIDDRLPAAR